MLFLRIPSKYLRLEITEADNIVSHKYQKQLITHFAMGVFLAQQLIVGNLCDRHMKQLSTFVLRRIYAKKPIVLYNQAMSLIAYGECEAAMVYLNQTIIMDHLPSRALKAWMLLKGREGVAKDENEAFELAEKGARLGCHHCQGVMAMCYSYSYRRDAVLSLKLARKSSEKGSKYGQFVLGYLYDFGEGCAPQDYAQAYRLYQLAVAQNFDEAQCSLGHLYRLGDGVAQNYVEALRWFQLAAAQGHPFALFSVAVCHEDGHGVRQNKTEAICWYKRALAAGDPTAPYTLQRLCA